MDSNNKNHKPFWQPWGAWGCLWRSLLFLLGIALICLLLAALLKDCNGVIDNPIHQFANDSINNPYRKYDNKRLPKDPYKDLPGDLREDNPVEDWRRTIPDVPELPNPDDNFIPPVDPGEIIADPENPIGEVVKGQLIVFFDSQNIETDMKSFAQQFKQAYPSSAYYIRYYNPAAGTMLLEVPENQMTQVADELPSKITGVDFYVTTNEIINSASARPADPSFSIAKYSENYELIQAYEAWNITKGSPDVKVAIIDSYFNLANKEIGERFIDNINISTKSSRVLPPARYPTEDEGGVGVFCHGSHVAGLAIGAQNNEMGCSGIAPECTWIPIALGSYPWQALSIYEGVLYAIYHGADVINMSLGNVPETAGDLPIGDQVLIAETMGKRAEEVWDYIVKVANDHKCIICKSAGNQHALMGIDVRNRNESIVNVEAVDGKGQKAKFSNFGIVDRANLHYSTVAAPGVDMWSSTTSFCVPIWKKMGYVADGDFQEMSGTSMAAPIVTGTIALLKSKNKDLTADQVIKILTMTAKQTDESGTIGPTIQIKDALDATGGELANFDDLMKDHNLLIGKWKSTHEINLVNATTNEKKDEMWVYFIFNSTSSGVLEYHTTMNSRKIYRANLNVKWGTSSITITQQDPAISSDGDTVNKDDFVCKPDKDRLLEASCQRDGVERYKFRLEKVN